MGSTPALGEQGGIYFVDRADFLSPDQSAVFLPAEQFRLADQPVTAMEGGDSLPSLDILTVERPRISVSSFGTLVLRVLYLIFMPQDRSRGHDHFGSKPAKPRRHGYGRQGSHSGRRGGLSTPVVFGRPGTFPC